MPKRIIVFFLICMELITLSGCWDYQDLDELSIPIVGIYDLEKSRNKRNDKITVGGIFPVLYPDTKAKYSIKNIKGENIGETREKRSLSSPESFIPGMLQVGIYGENLARKGLHVATENFLRAPDVKSTIYMAVIEGKAKDLAQLKLTDYPNPGIFLLELLKNAQKKAFLPSITLHLYNVNSHSVGKNPILPLLKITKKSRIQLSGTAIFNKDKLIAKIGLKDTRSLVMLRGLKGEGYLDFTNKKNGKKVDAGSVYVKRSRKVRVIRNKDKFTFFVTVKLNGILIEHTSKKKIIGQKNTIPIKEIENAVKQGVENDTHKFVKKMQNEFKVDCIDISKYALAKWRNELKGQIDKDFIQNAKIVVNAEVNIKEIGEET